MLDPMAIGQAGGEQRPRPLLRTILGTGAPAIGLAIILGLLVGALLDIEARRLIGLAGRAFSSPCRQCRCGAPGAGAREEYKCQSAYGGTRGCTAAA